MPLVSPGHLVVAPTGVDPVTSRFSVGLNNELPSQDLRVTIRIGVGRSHFAVDVGKLWAAIWPLLEGSVDAQPGLVGSSTRGTEPEHCGGKHWYPENEQQELG